MVFQTGLLPSESDKSLSLERVLCIIEYEPHPRDPPTISVSHTSVMNKRCLRLGQSRVQERRLPLPKPASCTLISVTFLPLSFLIGLYYIVPPPPISISSCSFIDPEVQKMFYFGLEVPGVS